MLARRLLAVEDVPQLGALVLRIPLTEYIAMREEALLGTRLFLVAPASAEGRVDFQLINRVEQRDRLQRVTAGVWSALFLGAALVDRILHVAHDELRAGFLREPISELDG